MYPAIFIFHLKNRKKTEMILTHFQIGGCPFPCPRFLKIDYRARQLPGFYLVQALLQDGNQFGDQLHQVLQLFYVCVFKYNHLTMLFPW